MWDADKGTAAGEAEEDGDTRKSGHGRVEMHRSCRRMACFRADVVEELFWLGPRHDNPAEAKYHLPT